MASAVELPFQVEALKMVGFCRLAWGSGRRGKVTLIVCNKARHLLHSLVARPRRG